MNIKIDALAVKKLMAEKRMTAGKLAQLSGLNYKTISRVVKVGHCNPATAGLLAAALDVDVEEIWKEDDPHGT